MLSKFLVPKGLECKQDHVVVNIFIQQSSFMFYDFSMFKEPDAQNPFGICGFFLNKQIKTSTYCPLFPDFELANSYENKNDMVAMKTE